MNILITGSNGLLGKAVLHRLKDNHQLTCIVQRDHEDYESSDNCRFIKLDLARDFDIDLLPKDMDVIVHLAQSPYYKSFPEQVEHVFSVNCHATLKLLDYARNANVKHFLFTSSGSVYEPYKESLIENTKLCPSSFYANSKLCAERLIQSYSSYFTTSILRLFFLYGPHKEKKQTIINTLIHRISQGLEVTIDGNGNGLRFNPTLTNDVAKCIMYIIERDIGGVMNVANPNNSSIAEIINLISQKLKMNANVRRNVESTAANIIPDLKIMKSTFPNDFFTDFNDGIEQVLKRCF